MDLVGAALRNPINRAILQRLPLLGAPQCWLVAGCIYQAAWNERVGRAPQSDIKDYDIFYFDDSDLSLGSGGRRHPARPRAVRGSRRTDRDPQPGARASVVSAALRRALPAPRPARRTASAGSWRAAPASAWRRRATAASGSIAPYGLDELEQGILGRTPTRRASHRFREKAKSYRARWPFLRIEDD